MIVTGNSLVMFKEAMIFIQAKMAGYLFWFVPGGLVNLAENRRIIKRTKTIGIIQISPYRLFKWIRFNCIEVYLDTVLFCLGLGQQGIQPGSKSDLKNVEGFFTCLFARIKFLKSR